MNSRTAIATQRLSPHWRAHAAHYLEPQKDLEPAAALLEAFRFDRFTFHSEDWLGADRTDARELLLRAWDSKGDSIPSGRAIQELFDKGMMPSLDKFLIFAALRKIEPNRQSAVTINALCSTLAQKLFWQELDILPHNHAAKKIVFEILEYEAEYEVSHELLTAACEKGYRFALDDFYPDELGWKRLNDFAPYIDYIKLDGKLVREGLAGNSVFFETISDLKARYPDIALIAEHVETPSEAFHLFDQGIAVVQGRSLPKRSLGPRP